MGGTYDVAIRHPNRETAQSKATKAAIVFLLLCSAGLIFIITFGGWSALQGAQIFAIAFALIDVLSAYYVSRWNRGILPVSGALAVFVAVLAAIAAPAWFARDKSGFHNPALNPSLLGLLCIVLIPVSLLLLGFAMRGFNQQWNIEVEEHHGES